MSVSRPTLFRALILSLSVALVLASCGGDDDDATPTPTLAPAATATSLPPAPTATPPPPTPALTATAPAATLEDGLLVSVGEHALWIRCWGEGAPTVVFDAPGPAADSSALGALPEEVAAFTRVCVYDRAGQGQSEAGGPSPTTAARQAAELATLLETAGESGPFIAAGYSWGGTVSYLLAASYPESSAGVVLIDAPHEDALRSIAATQSVFDNVDFPASADELEAAGPLGDIPLLVITRGLPSGPGEDDFPTWQAQQAAWLERSTASRQVIAEQSGHFDILETDLDVVVGAIEEWIATGDE